jgi:hypothetical protein
LSSNQDNRRTSNLKSTRSTGMKYDTITGIVPNTGI